MRVLRVIPAIALLAAGVLAVEFRAVASTPVAPGGNWPQWRGPLRDGVSTETGLLPEWPRGGPPKIWTKTGMGAGFSSLAISNGKIFTMGDRREGQFVIALDEETGAPLWSTRVGGRHDDEYGGPRATPTVDGALLYVTDTDGDLVALETATGRERWRKSLPRDYGAPTPGWMFAESPLVDGDRVLVAAGTSRAAIVAFNKLTGAEIWKTAMPNFGRSGVDGPEYSSIVISNGGGLKQYIRLIGRGVISVRASDGAFMWGYNRVANGTANISTPLIKDNFVFASTGYQTGAALLEIVPGAAGATTVSEKYFLNAATFQNHHGGMVLLGNHIYAGTGHNRGTPICIELATGRVVWGGNVRNAGEGSAAVLAADGRLYFRYQNGVMMQFEASPAGYKETGSFTIPGVTHPSWSHPVIAAGRLYLREQDALHVYNVKR